MFLNAHQWNICKIQMRTLFGWSTNVLSRKAVRRGEPQREPHVPMTDCVTPRPAGLRIVLTSCQTTMQMCCHRQRRLPPLDQNRSKCWDEIARRCVAAIVIESKRVGRACCVSFRSNVMCNQTLTVIKIEQRAVCLCIAKATGHCRGRCHQRCMHCRWYSSVAHRNFATRKSIRKNGRFNEVFNAHNWDLTLAFGLALPRDVLHGPH